MPRPTLKGPIALLRALCSCVVFMVAATGALLAQPIPAVVPQGTLFHDFDRDGIQERLLSRPGTNEIQSWAAASQSWVKADYALPEGVTLVDASGADAGLRFIDLNGDGYDDVLFSNPERFAIYLWSKNVRPDLGWNRGWSQFIRAGKRAGKASEPPSLTDAQVKIDRGDLVVTRPASAGRAASVERRSLKELIAFDMPSPKSPTEALASFRVRPGFRVELVACEPIVTDPVYFDWDGEGRLWVVEMRDYPLGLDGKGKPGGVVKMLEDADGDGRYEKATTFLEGIAFPSSLMPWGKGLLIAAAPDIFYAEDTDGDGRADVRKTLFTGFVQGNQQHRVNGFEWGLDGWVYAANGDSGGSVKSIATGKTISISGRDIRFHPNTGDIETVSAQTQFGRRRDDWGNWFGNNNPTWLWHVMLPEHYLRRNPRLAVKRVSRVLANYDNSTRVFPASAPMIRPNQPWSLNHVTSGCSPTPYRDDAFGPDFATTVFASEPVHNAIHREVLAPEGPGFASHRAKGEEQSEFLSSDDNWFRPVTTHTGPDGALYVADMYRFVIEHPEWISSEMQARLDLRAGSDKGRIYRVSREGQPRRALPNLARKTTRELALAMDSMNGWQRDTVQRLLVERADPKAGEWLLPLLNATHAPQVRLQALATLGGLHALTARDAIGALGDPHPAVRCEALRQSEALAPGGQELFHAVARLASEAEASVRFQAAFSLGAWPSEDIEPVLRQLVTREDTDEWTRIAVMSSLRPDSALFKQLKTDAPMPKAAAVRVALTPSSADRAQVIAGYSSVDSLKGDPQRGRAQFQALCQPCHRLRGEGNEVGPDLGMVGAKPVDWLLAAVLDPNQSVEARYRAWQIRLRSGEDLTGLISAETGNNIVVRVAGGVEHAVLRGDISSMEPSKLSLMPTGFESALKPQDMADLLRWLRGP
ncbi:MAG: c-type cytochrome [Verrucomicrobia bacterium]|nr:c-type cytochrome [Verrucomicrobiota bacterium]